MNHRFDPCGRNHGKHDQHGSSRDHPAGINRHSLPVNNEKDAMREPEEAEGKENASKREEPKSLLDAKNRTLDRSWLMPGHMERHDFMMPSTGF
jgi:hypothetical protein